MALLHPSTEVWVRSANVWERHCLYDLAYQLHELQTPDLSTMVYDPKTGEFAEMKLPVCDGPLSRAVEAGSVYQSIKLSTGGRLVSGARTLFALAPLSKFRYDIFRVGPDWTPARDKQPAYMGCLGLKAGVGLLRTPFQVHPQTIFNGAYPPGTAIQVAKAVQHSHCTTGKMYALPDLKGNLLALPCGAMVM